MRRLVFALAAAFAAIASPAAAQEQPPNVVLVTIDGLRWQEVFRGADPTLVRDPEYRARYIDVPNRAQALMPFLNGFAQTGALIGNRDAGSCAQVTNDFWFSYPGYAELLAGRPNPAIRFNQAVPNNDITVLERLQRRPDFANRVRVYAAWDAVPAIVNAERSGIPVFTASSKDAPQDGEVTTAWRAGLADAPRATWIALGDTDTYAHAGDYPGYLRAASAADAFLSELWGAIEADSRTAGRTTLIVTADHGRGESARNRWRGHGSGRWRGIVVPGLRKEGSDAIFIGLRGSGITNGAAYTMSNCATAGQVASTLLQRAGAASEITPDMAAPLAVFAR